MIGLENIKDSNILDVMKKYWQELLKLFNKQDLEDIEKQRLIEEEKAFLKIIQKAKDDWIESQNYFDNVSDPDLIDLAIHRMEAAEIFYMYLIKEAKRKGISALESEKEKSTVSFNDSL